MDGLLPGATFGRYRIEGIVGRGGMASVYRATETALDRQVALKVVLGPSADDPGFRARLRSEAQAAAAIEHPHVVPIYDADEYDGIPFIAMRLIDGESLAQVVARSPLGARRAVGLIVQIAGALHAAHSRGVLHRDVKPANVLLSRGGDHAYVSDFGVAWRMGGAAVPGELVGTPGYLAPEALRGEPVDRRADVYSLGCTLFELLTGEVPFAGARERAPVTPDALEALLVRTLSSTPDERPQTAAEFAACALAAVDRRRTPRVRGEQAPARGNITARPGRLIGRAQELAALAAACRDADGVVSLVGPGGVGKTRLALAVAEAVAADFEDGCFVVELEAVADAADVIGAVVRTLGLTDDDAPLERLARYLSGRRMLLILDNFEQVVDAAAEVAQLAARAPSARVLVTSQAPLRVRGERVIRLPPLALPGVAVADPAVLAEVPSVALLVSHAREADPGFALTAGNARAVARICVQLDGLPLALELAAARVALFGALELSERLGADLSALGRGARDLPARQRGLRATLDWTTGLLGAGERELLLQLAVFAGGFTAELVEAVGDDDAIEYLAALFDVALVRRERDGRYWISPPVRLYALERLRAGGGEPVARVRQAQALTVLAERAEALWWTDMRASKLAFADEAQNITEALGALRGVEPCLHARLLAAAARWFSDSGRSLECVAEIDAALADVSVAGSLRARLLCRRAVAVESDDPTAASEAAVAACREFGTGRDLVEALFGLSTGFSVIADGEGAMRAAREARMVARGLNDSVATDLADLATGTALALLGRPAEALALVTLLDRRLPPDGRIAMNTTVARADTALACGDAVGALEDYGRWLRTHHALNSYFTEAFQLDGAAMALTALKRFEEAVIAAEIADLLRQEWTIEAPPVYRESRDAELARSYRALGPLGVEHARATARRLGVHHGPLWVASHVDPAPTIQPFSPGSPSPVTANRG